MTKKKIYKQWTVKSFDLEKFDDEINSNLEIGWEIVEGSYSISEVDGKKMVSQVLVWKDDDDENLYLEFNLSGEWRDGVMEQTNNKLMTISKEFFHRDKKDSRTCIKWEKDKFGDKYSREKNIYFSYTKDVPVPQQRKKYYELKNGDGKILELNEYNEDGIKHGNYIDNNLKGEFINGEPSGTWSFNSSQFGTLSGDYLGRNHIDNFRIIEDEIGRIFILYSEVFKQELYEELNEKEGKNVRIVTEGTSKWTQEDFEEVEKSYFVFESVGDTPIRFFSGGIQLRTQQYQDDDRKYFDIQIIDGRIIEGMVEDIKIKKFDDSLDKFEPNHVVPKRVEYRQGQKYIVKEYNPETKSIIKEVIYFPKTLIKDRYLCSPNRVCVEKYYTGEGYNKPKGTWKRYFPDGQLNLTGEFVPYLQKENSKSIPSNKDCLFKRKLKYFDSDGVLRYQSLSIISIPVYLGTRKGSNFRTVEVLDEKNHFERDGQHDIILGLDVRFERFINLDDTFDWIYDPNGPSIFLDGVFKGVSSSFEGITHREILINKFYIYDKNGDIRTTNGDDTFSYEYDFDDDF